MHEDVKQHLAKAGTPTMGGTVFLLVATSISFLIGFFSFHDGQSLGLISGILSVVLIYGIIGFLDDFLKIFKQINEGLTAKQKVSLAVGWRIDFLFFTC